MKNRLVSALVFCAVLVNVLSGAAAASIQPSSGDSPYLETHFQINFTDITASISKTGVLNLSPDLGLSPEKHQVAVDNIHKLEEIFLEFPDLQESISATLQSVCSSNELKAISFTSVPLMEVDGHYERIPNVRPMDVGESVPSPKANFLLSTMVIGGVVREPNGNFKYSVYTKGSWSKNSVLGGSDYPATGTDYVLQSVPSTFARKSYSFSATYNQAPISGANGTDFWLQDGDSSFLEYAVLDDPAGTRQLKSFTLQVQFSAPSSSVERTISSYYVHTWSELTLSVNASLTTVLVGALTITPSIGSNQWQVYNPVDFDF